MNHSFWKPVDLVNAQITHRTIDKLRIWLRKNNDEIWFAFHHATDDEALTEEPPETAEWSRWILTAPTDSIILEPVMPDNPMVILPEHPMHLSVDARIQFFTRIPLWVRLRTEAKKPETITEIPIFQLSKTWFGSVTEGELCYYSTTKARRELSTDISRPYLINCPIWIENESDTPLHFEKFCFRVEFLTIYESDGEFWADETTISYQGEDQISHVSMRGKLPKQLSSPLLRNKARKSLPGNLAKRTFQRIIDDFPFIHF